MIIKEGKQMGIPIIGLINSDELISVDYPIIGNNNSIYLVHFFCYFLAHMISKQILGRRHV